MDGLFYLIEMNIKSVLKVLTSLFFPVLMMAQSNPDSLMNQWHRAASRADFHGYFNLTTDDFIFLGTAPGERWVRSEFEAFSKPYFDRGKAWDFKPSNRKWVYSENGKTAWFDEDLDTWMRGCRGSGILIKKRGKWKLAYYNLTVLIENEKMKEFIELRDAPNPEK
ncbi:MAG: hypothetical protein RIT43_714 [Bacteroidota bacterium]|jgi:ketosteroid isomerase-like protein